MQLNNAPAALVALILLAVVIGIAAKIFSSMAEPMKAYGNPVIQNVTVGITSNATGGIGEMANFMPIVGLVLAAAIIIGLVVTAFALKQ